MNEKCLECGHLKLTMTFVVQLQETICVSGQIALIPGSMTLCSGGIECQTRLSLRHVARILSAHSGESGRLTLQHVVQAVCYVTSQEYIAVSKRQWRMSFSDGNIDGKQNSSEESQAVITYVIVSSLPKGALVEWHVVANDQARHFTGPRIFSSLNCTVISTH